MKKLIDKVKIFGIILIVIVLVALVVNLVRPKYYNNYTSCSEGFYYYASLLGIIKSGCKDCPKGKYCPGDNKTHSCYNDETTTRYTRATSSNDCKYCKDETKTLVDGKCVTCPIGSYCEFGKATKCPEGKTTKTKGNKYSSACVCKEGLYSTGYFCEKCPKVTGGGSFSSPIGSTSINKCAITVPKGKYITCDKKGCNIKMCEGDTYKEKSQVVNYKDNLKTTCSKCPTGKVANSTHTACVCKAGTYLSNGKCVACPKCNGNVTCFTTAAGATSVTQCMGTVPKGKYITCDKNGCTVNTCSGNTYSNSKNVKYSTTLKTSCISCGTDKVNNTHTACIIEPKKTSCSSGEYLTDGKCKSCPKCNGAINCFTTDSNATSSSDCTGTVPAGKYIKCTAISCVVKDCTGNTYSNKKNVTYSTNLSTSCTSCGKKKANSNHTGCV